MSPLRPYYPTPSVVWCPPRSMLTNCIALGQAWVSGSTPMLWSIGSNVVGTNSMSELNSPCKSVLPPPPFQRRSRVCKTVMLATTPWQLSHRGYICNFLCSGGAAIEAAIDAGETSLNHEEPAVAESAAGEYFVETENWILEMSRLLRISRRKFQLGLS